MSAATGTRKTASRTPARRPVSKTKRLNDEAHKLVHRNAPEIAKSLYDSTLKGRVMSARLLLELAAGSAKAKGAAPLPSLAEALAAEMQWQVEVKEAEAETGFGGREPE